MYKNFVLGVALYKLSYNIKSIEGTTTQTKRGEKMTYQELTKLNKMQAEELLETLNKAWMKSKHHAIVTNPDAFKTSKYFTAFLNFVKFVKRTNLPDTQSFIELMVKEKIEPIFWSKDVAYGKYLEYINRRMPTEKLIEITVKTLFDVADAAEVEVSEIFDAVLPNDVIQLVQQRRLSPWILLNSKKFANFFIEKTNTEERVILESIISPDYWTARFQMRPTDLKLAKDCVSALGL